MECSENSRTKVRSQNTVMSPSAIKRKSGSSSSQKRAKTGPKGLGSASRRAVVFTPRTSPLPPQYSATLRYAETFTLTLTVGAFNSYVFSCNGMYDPNITGTGHQPMYFDQIMQLYNHYHVKASRCWISACLPNDVGVAITQALVVEDNASLATGSVGAMSEMPGQKGPMVVTDAAQLQLPVKYASWTAKEVFGGNLLANNDLRGNVTTNPAEQAYYIFGAQDNNGTSVTLVCGVTLEYDCIFTEYKGVSQS